MAREVVSIKEVAEVAATLIVAVVVVSLHRCILDGVAHPLYLAIGPRVIWFGQAMLDPVRLTDHIKPHLAESHADAIPRLLCELDTIIGQDGCLNSKHTPSTNPIR